MPNKHNQLIAIKMFDEGTTSPFPARLLLQTFHFRDQLLRDPKEYKRFDKLYSPVIDNFIELKLALKNLTQLFEQHEVDVKNGSAIKIHPGGQISVMKSINNQYRAYVKDFFIKGEIVISAIPRVAEVFDLKVGFLFGKQNKFDKEAEQFRSGFTENADFLLDYIRTARATWYKTFNDIRNDIEHGSIEFPPVSYKQQSDGTVEVNFPTFSSRSLVELLEELEYSVLELVERCLLFFFSTKLQAGMLIKEIPSNQLKPNVVARYRLYMRFGDQDVPYGGSM